MGSEYLDMIREKKREEERKPTGSSYETTPATPIAPSSPLRSSSYVTGKVPTGSPRAKPTTVEVFRKGIKREPSSFPILKDERLHDKWHKSMHVTAKQQGIGNVLDEYYIPSNEEEVERIKTPDGYTIPLVVTNGLPRMKMCPYTDHEWDTLPHIFFTEDAEWDTKVLDHDPTEDLRWYDTLEDAETDGTFPLFDARGEYQHRVTMSITQEYIDAAGNDIDLAVDSMVHASLGSDNVQALALHAMSLRDDYFDAFEKEDTQQTSDNDPTLTPPESASNSYSVCATPEPVGVSLTCQDQEFMTKTTLVKRDQ